MGSAEAGSPCQPQPTKPLSKTKGNITRAGAGCLLQTPATITTTITTAQQRRHLPPMHAQVHQFRVQHRMPTATDCLVFCIDGLCGLPAACLNCSPVSEICAIRPSPAHCSGRPAASPHTHPFLRRLSLQQDNSKPSACCQRAGKSSGCSSTHARKEPRVQRQPRRDNLHSLCKAGRGCLGVAGSSKAFAPLQPATLRVSPKASTCRNLQLPHITTTLPDHSAGTQGTSWHKQCIYSQARQ